MRSLSILLVSILFSISLASSYNIVGEFDPNESALNATLTLLWTNKLEDPTSTVLLNLFPNLHRRPNPHVLNVPEHSPGGLEIHGVWHGKEPLRYELSKTFVHTYQVYSKDETMLEVHLPLEIPPGSSIELTISFTTHIPREPSGDEFCWNGFCLWRFGWYPIEVHVESGEYYDGYILEPHTCRISLKVPEGWEFVTHEGEGLGCPLVLLKGYRHLRIEGERYEVHVHYTPGNRERAMLIGGTVLKALNEISSRFGYLDYREIHVLQSPLSGLFGMTTNGLVVLGDNAFSTGDLVLPGFFYPINEFLVHHEVAHLWFGIGVEPDFFRDNFLSESLAQYVSITDMERTYGPEKNLYDDVEDITGSLLKSLLLFKSIRENYLYIYRDLWRSGLDSSIRGPHEFLNQNLPLDYAKGYFAFRTLDVALKGKLDSVLKDFHDRYKNNVVNFDTFKEFLISRTNISEDLIENLFSGEKTYLKVENGPENLRIEAPEWLPYEVLITHTDGSTELSTLKGSTNLSREEIARVDLDPNWKVPDPDRFDNHFPPLFAVKGFEDEGPSPLESYTLSPAFFTLSVSSSDLILSTGFGITKFDEWGFSIHSGYRTGIDGSSRTLVLGLGGFQAGAFHEISGNVILSENGLEYADLYLNLSLPESLDVGMEMPLLHPRNSIQASLRWLESPLLVAQYSFMDPVKTGIFSRIGIVYDGDLLPFGDFVKIFGENLDVHLWGVYDTGSGGDSISPYGSNYNPYDLRFKAFGSATLGLHMNFSMFDRLKILNLFSFRGGTLSTRIGLEGGLSSGEIRGLLDFEASFTPELYTILDRTIGFRVFTKIVYDLEDGSLHPMVGLDSDLPEILITGFLTENRPFSRILPPVFRIHLSEP